MLSKIATRGGFGLAAVTLAVCLQPHAASASSLTPLYFFCSQNNCTDGNMPIMPVLRDAAGNIFGTTLSDGATDGGTVFVLKKSHNKYKFQRIYLFCQQTNCTDGKEPSGSLIADVNGNVYGTVKQGGKHGHGAIFKLTPNAKQTKWKISLIYNFCLKSDCADGADPYAGLTYQGASSGVSYDGTSPLFGTTTGGGTGGGIAYQMTLTKKNAKVKAIYNFCSQTNCADGYFPEAGLTMDANGNLFGATDSGGTQNSGVAYELSPQVGGGYAQTTLYTFCSLVNCADGTRPDYTLAMDGNGDLYGSTQNGGNSRNDGVIFKIHPNGTQSTETALYTFCPSADCTDGYLPIGPLTVDANGDILGTTQNGGPNDFGIIFKLHGSSESVLYSFCALSNCNDGAAPYGGVVLDPSGNMYGTTITGGANGNGGVVFEFKP